MHVLLILTARDAVRDRVDGLPTTPSFLITPLSNDVAGAAATLYIAPPIISVRRSWLGMPSMRSMRNTPSCVRR